MVLHKIHCKFHANLICLLTLINRIFSLRAFQAIQSKLFRNSRFSRIFLFYLTFNIVAFESRYLFSCDSLGASSSEWDEKNSLTKLVLCCFFSSVRSLSLALSVCVLCSCFRCSSFSSFASRVTFITFPLRQRNSKLRLKYPNFRSECYVAKVT